MGHVKPQTFINVPKKKKKKKPNKSPQNPTPREREREREREVNPPFKRTNGARVGFLFESLRRSKSGI